MLCLRNWGEARFIAVLFGHLGRFGLSQVDLLCLQALCLFFTTKVTLAPSSKKR